MPGVFMSIRNCDMPACRFSLRSLVRTSAIM
jgi:hypothetical protein